MRKLIPGALIGGIIIFFWQFLSFALLDLHRSSQQYTPRQTEILNYLGSQFNQDGAYFLPTYPDGAPDSERERLMKEQEGKPWAMITYHTRWENNMGMNIVRGLLVDIVMVGLLCWIIARFENWTFSRVFIASIFTGLISFLDVPYTNHIWYHWFDLMAYLVDALVGWGLVGLWLGWLYSRKRIVSKA